MVERARRLDPPRFEIDHANGTSVEVRRAPMPDGGFVTTYADITDRRRAERQTLARREAEAANAAKSHFLRNMSHDLRKPVNAIIEFNHLVLERAREVLPDRHRRNLEHVDVTSRHLLDMVDELLEMARIEAGQIEVRPELVPLAPIIERCAMTIRPLVEAKGLEFTYDVEADLRVTTDPRLMSRVVLNLCDNAAQYTPSGHIRVHAGQVGDVVEVQVIDTGVGIAAESIAQVFQTFERGEQTAGLTKAGVGLGLGLSISREFARLLGGDISVSSHPGHGSTFTLSIPICSPSERANQGANV